MKNIIIKLGVLAGSAAFIVGSGGGSVNVISYETFNSSAKETSVLVGVTQQVSGLTGDIKLLGISGSLNHDTGAIGIDDGDYKLTDADGADNNGAISDGQSSLNYKTNFTGNYKYARQYEQNYQIDGVSYDSFGIMGIGTLAADMPKVGTASYSGEAEALAAIGDKGYDLKTGTSVLNANFATGKTSLSLSKFSAFDQTTGLATIAPIDEIKVTDMAIVDGKFSGGKIETYNQTILVNVMGENPISTSEGAFFGLDNADNTPVETGGRVLMQSEDSIISATYLAKKSE